MIATSSPPTASQRHPPRLLPDATDPPKTYPSPVMALEFYCSEAASYYTCGRMLILLIEDDPAIVRFLERGLAAHGHRTISADNGEEGLFMPPRRPWNWCFST